MKDESAKDLVVLPAMVIGAGGLGLAAAEIVLRVFGDELPRWYPQALAGVVGFVPAWMITAICFKQKHTYDARIYEGRPGCMVPAWLFFLSVILVMTAVALGGPAVLVFLGLEGLGRNAARRETPWIAGALLGAGLFALAVSVSALSRGLLLWSMQRHLEQLPTSTVRGAALGLVELRGAARPLDGKPGMIFGRPTEGEEVSARPFDLEDATGRVRVEPPPAVPGDDPRMALRRHETYGLPMLEAGDEVLVLGGLREDAGRPGERVVAPWRPPHAWFGTRILSRPEIFLLSGGGEAAAKRVLYRARLGWLALGTLLIAGSLVVVAASAAGLLRTSLLSSFRVFGP